MALGAFNIVEEIAAIGPVRFLRCTVVGDGAYAAGGSTGLLAALRAATKQPGLNIIDVRDAYGSATTRATHVVYDHANEKLVARTTSTGAEFATADQSGTTHTLLIIAC